MSIYPCEVGIGFKARIGVHVSLLENIFKTKATRPHIVPIPDFLRYVGNGLFKPSRVESEGYARGRRRKIKQTTKIEIGQAHTEEKYRG